MCHIQSEDLALPLQLLIPIVARTTDGAQKLLQLIEARGQEAEELSGPLKMCAPLPSCPCTLPAHAAALLLQIACPWSDAVMRLACTDAGWPTRKPRISGSFPSGALCATAPPAGTQRAAPPGRSGLCSLVRPQSRPRKAVRCLLTSFRGKHQDGSVDHGNNF